MSKNITIIDTEYKEWLNNADGFSLTNIIYCKNYIHFIIKALKFSHKLWEN